MQQTYALRRRGNVTRLSSYLAAAAGVAGASAAQAALVFTPGPIPLNSSNTAANIDFNGDNLTDIAVELDLAEGAGTPPGQVEIFKNGAAKGDAGVDVGNVLEDPNTFNVTPLNFGDTIGAVPPGGSEWTDPFGDPIIDTDPTFGVFPRPVGGNPSEVKYIGVQLDFAGDANADPDFFYGWIGYRTLTLDENGITGEITGFGYNDTLNGEIQAGVVPEPTSLALLAVGAAGLLGYRRRG